MYRQKNSQLSPRETQLNEILEEELAGKRRWKYSPNKRAEQTKRNRIMPTERYGHRIVCQAIFHGGRLARLVRIRVTEHERSASGSVSTGLSRRKIKPLPAEVVIGSIVFSAGARNVTRPDRTKLPEVCVTQ